MDTWGDFISVLTEVELLKLVKDEAIEEWGRDIPKSLMFSRFGKGIANNFDRFLPDDRDHIFNVIERGMGAKQDDLKTLVATGLLEALYMQSSRDVMLWERVHEKLREKSRQYLIDWGSRRRS